MVGGGLFFFLILLSCLIFLFTARGIGSRKTVVMKIYKWAVDEQRFLNSKVLLLGSEQHFPSLPDHFQSTVCLQTQYRQLDTQFSLQLRGMTDSFMVSCHGFVYKGFTWLTEHSGAQKDLGLWERCFSQSPEGISSQLVCSLVNTLWMHHLFFFSFPRYTSAI